MRNYGVDLIDIILPRFCPSCKTRLTPDVPFICEKCLRNIKKPDSRRIKLEYDKKFSGSHIISGFTSQFIFERDKELQHIVHSLKYERKFLLGVYLGRLLGEIIMREFSQYALDTVVPVPLHHLKAAEREFNQSLYIAKGIHKATGLKVSSRLIKRKRYTESQTTMNITERDNNIRGAFVSGKKLNGENILLIDDVITTGSTIRECGRILLSAGAGKIYAASIAVAD